MVYYTPNIYSTLESLQLESRDDGLENRQIKGYAVLEHTDGAHGSIGELSRHRGGFSCAE